MKKAIVGTIATIGLAATAYVMNANKNQVLPGQEFSYVHELMRTVEPLSLPEDSFQKQIELYRNAFTGSQTCSPGGANLIDITTGESYGILPDASSRITQEQINEARDAIRQSGSDIANGSRLRHPFVINCDRASENMVNTIKNLEEKITGSWRNNRITAVPFNTYIQDTIKDSYIGRLQAQTGIDYIIQGIISVESGGNRHLVSRSGARGALQIMPGTAQACNEEGNVFHRMAALECALFTLEQMGRVIRRSNGLQHANISDEERTKLELYLVIQSYNTGATRVRREFDRYMQYVNQQEREQKPEQEIEQPYTADQLMAGFNVYALTRPRNGFGPDATQYVRKVLAAAEILKQHFEPPDEQIPTEQTRWERMTEGAFRIIDKYIIQKNNRILGK